MRTGREISLMTLNDEQKPGAKATRLKPVQAVVHDIHQEIGVGLCEAHRGLDAEHIAIQTTLAHQNSHVLHVLKCLSQLSGSRGLQLVVDTQQAKQYLCPCCSVKALLFAGNQQYVQ